MLREFIKSDSGATAIEYGFIAGLVSLAIFATLVTLGASLETAYASISDQMAAAIAPPPPAPTKVETLALFTEQVDITTLR